MPRARGKLPGLAVMRFGLAVRRISLPVCILAWAALVCWSLLRAGGPGAHFPLLLPFASGKNLGFGVWMAQAVAMAVGLLLGLRLLAFAIGAVGWWLLPADHRDLLSRLGGAAPAPDPCGDGETARR